MARTEQHTKLMVLTQDVVNPEPDGRRRRDWRYEPVWHKGMKLEHFTWDLDLGDDPKNPRMVNELRGTHYHHQSLPEKRPGYALLMEHLVEAEPSLDALLAEKDWANYPLRPLLQRLVDSGKLSLDDVREAIEAVEAKWDEEQASESERVQTGQENS